MGRGHEPTVAATARERRRPRPLRPVRAVVRRCRCGHGEPRGHGRGPVEPTVSRRSAWCCSNSGMRTGLSSTPTTPVVRDVSWPAIPWPPSCSTGSPAAARSASRARRADRRRRVGRLLRHPAPRRTDRRPRLATRARSSPAGTSWTSGSGRSRPSTRAGRCPGHRGGADARPSPRLRVLAEPRGPAARPAPLHPPRAAGWPIDRLQPWSQRTGRPLPPTDGGPGPRRAGSGMFLAWQMTRRWSRIGPASFSTSSTREHPGRGVPGPPVRRGLAWVSFPEGPRRARRAARPPARGGPAPGRGRGHGRRGPGSSSGSPWPGPPW